MPFLLPALPAIASAAGSVVGGLFGKKTGGPSAEQKQSSNLLNAAAQQGMEQSTQARNTGMGFLNKFSSTLGAPTNYFQSLLSGNQARTTAALAPDISRISGTTQAATQAASTLAPRGGGRSSVLFNLPQQAASQVSGLFNTVRPQAAEGLTRIAGMQGQVGSSLMNTGANFLSAGVGAARSLADQANILRDQQSKAGAGASSLVSNILTSLLSKVGGGGGPGSPGQDVRWTPGGPVDPWAGAPSV